MQQREIVSGGHIGPHLHYVIGKHIGFIQSTAAIFLMLASRLANALLRLAACKS